MNEQYLTDGNWDYLLTLLPANWQELAKTSGGVLRLRGAGSLSSLLRTLLLHVAHGASLRTTSIVAKAAGWAHMSDVALLKKLRVCDSTPIPDFVKIKIAFEGFGGVPESCER